MALRIAYFKPAWAIVQNMRFSKAFIFVAS